MSTPDVEPWQDRLVRAAVRDRLDRGVDATFAAADLRLYGLHLNTVQENQMPDDQTPHLSAVPTAEPDHQGPDLTEAERLGVLVGRAYGAALAERDQARQVAAEAIGHLTHVLDTTPTGTFAAGNTAQDAAREWLAAVASTTQTAPGQEPTPS